MWTLYSSVLAMCARCASVTDGQPFALNGIEEGVRRAPSSGSLPRNAELTQLIHCARLLAAARPGCRCAKATAAQLLQSAGIHGHCPLFTHPAAALAFKVGEATEVASVAAGGAAVAVAPIVIAVGSTDIVGTTGET